MSIRSGLFDSTSVVETAEGFPRGNKAESADFFARYFSRFIGNGVCANPTDGFAVVAGSGLNITVKAGDAFINGYYAFAESNQSLTITSSATAKMVRVVLRLDTSAGSITLALLDGTTTLTRSGNVYELALADIAVAANATAIIQSNITDLRLNTSLCGSVTGITWTPDTSAYATQLASLADDAQDAVEELEDCLDEKEEEFDEWFEGVKSSLSTLVSASDALTLNSNKANKDLSNVTESSVSYAMLNDEIKKLIKSAQYSDFYSVRII